jgi:hypothetical protein
MTEALLDRLDHLERANRELAGRLDRAERDRRRLVRVAATAMVGAAMLAGLGAAAGTRVLEAERLVIRDRDGEPRIELGTIDGVAYLFLLDGDGIRRVDLNARSGAVASLLMNDPDGRLRAALGTKGDRSYLLLHAREGGRAVDLGVGPDDVPHLFLHPPGDPPRDRSD